MCVFVKLELQTKVFDEIAVLRTRFPIYPRKQMVLFRLSDEVGSFSVNVSSVKLHCVGRFLNKSRNFFFPFHLNVVSFFIFFICLAHLCNANLVKVVGCTVLRLQSTLDVSNFNNSLNSWMPTVHRVMPVWTMPSYSIHRFLYKCQNLYSLN